MNAVERPPLVVRATMGLEGAAVLDRPVQMVRPWARSWFGSGTRGTVLRGEWLGHALHPVLTDAVVGTWVSATLLDLLGGKDMSPAAQRLIGIGLLSAAPTAWTGWAEWSTAGPREQRVGLVHAVTNGVAIGAYAASWLARRRGEHGRGRRMAIAGAGVAGVGAYLGGHLAAARKVGSYNPAFDEAPTAG